MTTPLPQARTNRQPNEVIDNDDINLLATVANRADTNAAAAQAQAAEALTTAEAAYVLPPGGIGPSDLAPGAVSLVVLRPGTNGWAPRPSPSLSITYQWSRYSITEPAVPIGVVNGQQYAVVGHDLIVQPPA